MQMAAVAVAVAMAAGTAMAQQAAPGYGGTAAGDTESWAQYTGDAAAALGVFRNIPLYQATPEGWVHGSGQYLPLTVDGKVPAHFDPCMDSDRPMQLPTEQLPWGGGEGQSIPYGVVGRMAGTDPEVQWVFLARHYKVMDPKDTGAAFDELNDVAVIGHHPRTGATVFFQYYNTEAPQKVDQIPSPFNLGSDTFWQGTDWLSDDGTACSQCHSADPFIHTPWISQAKMPLSPATTDPDTVVPSAPLGPYYVLARGKLATAMDAHLAQMAGSPADNYCLTCHRIGVSDSVGLYNGSTLGAASADYQPHSYSASACHPDHGSWQTAKFAAMPWMPPADPSFGDFYALQPDFRVAAEREGWASAYQANAAQVLDFIKAHDGTAGSAATDASVPAAIPLPAPPADQRQIMVARPEADSVAAGKLLLVVDQRMRANTDTALDTWRFVADAGAGAGMTARAVILERVADASCANGFRVRSIGAPVTAKEAGSWQALTPGGTISASAGDFMALILQNSGIATGRALIPYSDDSAWARVPQIEDNPTIPDTVRTLTEPLDALPQPGALLCPGNPAYRTYSVEFHASV